jgi:hypothetical protein
MFIKSNLEGPLTKGTGVHFIQCLFELGVLLGLPVVEPVRHYCEIIPSRALRVFRKLPQEAQAYTKFDILFDCICI